MSVEKRAKTGLGAGGRRTLREVASPAEAVNDLDDESDNVDSGFSVDLLCGAQIYGPEMGLGSRFQRLGYLEALECRIHCSEDRVLYSGLLNRCISRLGSIHLSKSRVPGLLEPTAPAGGRARRTMLYLLPSYKVQKC